MEQANPTGSAPTYLLSGSIARYGVAILAVVAGALLRAGVTAIAGEGLPTFVTFYPAVMLAAVLGGFWPGIAATVLAALVADYWFIAPRGLFVYERLVDAVAVVLFFGMGLFMSAVAELYHRNRLKAAAYDKEVALQESRAALARERANLQAIFDAANIGLLLIDEHGIVQRVNDTVARWVDKDLSAFQVAPRPGDFVGCIHALAESAGCGHNAQCTSCPIRAAFQTALDSGRPVHGVETEAVLSIGGKEVRLWLEISADPLSLDGRRHVVLALSNITARKQAEQALHSAAEKLKQSNQDLEQFAYAASHDLQEPLRAISGFLQLLEDRYAGQLDAKAKEFIDYSVDGARRMSNLIDDLLAYSRVDRKGKTPQPVDARTALATALANLQAGICEAQAKITHDERLPTVTADGTQLAQLLQNLIGNAIKFRKPDEPCLVHVDARRGDGQWVFSVRDNGIGIASDQHDRIFEIFQRLHGRAKYPGTGIGLAICKRIVQRHGGRIWLESQAGEGATFFFSIPDKNEQLD